MPHYKVPNDAQPHFLSEEDVGAGAESLLPAGAIRIAEAEADAMRAALQPAFADIKAMRLASVREVREIALNRLTGIRQDAADDGDAVTVSACRAAKDELKNITTCPPVSAATTDAELCAALVAEYARIANAAVGASPALAKAFADFRL